jgi:hypothetical protein
VLAVNDLHPDALAQAIRTTLDFVPDPVALDMDGASVSTRLLKARSGRVATRWSPARIVDRMNAWLDPVRAALDTRTSPLTIFVRDDDAGRDELRLYRLLDVCRYYNVPIDLAAIPLDIDGLRARELRGVVEESHGLIAIHQHGFAHVNHETTGRSCEFGPSRSAVDQCRDIVEGRRRLEDAFGAPIAAMFTPPWNRCTAVTAACLVELGFRLLSCDATAPRFEIDGLAELPVHLDWTGRRGARTGPGTWGEAIARRLAGAGVPVGLMLHHAGMSATDRRLLAELFAVITRHPNVCMRSMAESALPALPQSDGE